jgi:hypothetical protein
VPGVRPNSLWACRDHCPCSLPSQSEKSGDPSIVDFFGVMQHPRPINHIDFLCYRHLVPEHWSLWIAPPTGWGLTFLSWCVAVFTNK